MDQVRENPLDLLLRKIRTHHPLSRDSEAAILALPFKLRTLDAQAYLLREGDRPDRCAVLLSGFAFRHKLTGHGARQIMAIHIPGEALDFQNMFLSESDHNVQMLTRGQVAEISREPLERLVLDNPEIGRAVMIFTLVEASIFREWVLNIGRRDARSRIAHLLCEFAYRMQALGLDTESVHELPMTQEQLADATGLTAVHVNRVLQALQRDGLIERERRIIRFVDWERLREAADFNARYLHTREFEAAPLHLG